MKLQQITKEAREHGHRYYVRVSAADLKRLERIVADNPRAEMRVQDFLESIIMYYVKEVIENRSDLADLRPTTK